VAASHGRHNGHLPLLAIVRTGNELIAYRLPRPRGRLVFLALASLVWAAVGADADESRSGMPTGPVDLLMINGHIKTATGWSEALAIDKGVIVALGTGKELAPLADRNTRVLDLGGDTVLPGLHDLHVHPIFAGISAKDCLIAQGSSLKETQRTVKACVAKAQPHVWITGGQWDASALGRVPNRALLDAVAPDNPVLLWDTSAHSSWANSKALTLIGITRRTPDPAHGIIERDASGEPTGVLREAAADMAATHIPKHSLADAEAALAWSTQEMLSFGITSFTEAAVGFSTGAENELEAYTALSDAGNLKQRVRLCLVWTPGDAKSEALIAARNVHARGRMSVDCVKIFLDGVPTDSHTAALLEDYQGAAGTRADEASRRGLLLIPQDVLNEAVTRFDKMGLTVKFHAAGDAAVREGLNAIEAARKANGFGPQMHNVGHCTFVAPEDIARARAIEATFEVSPYLWGPTPINDSISAAVGPKLIERVWPVREMIDSGALVVPGSDWSVVPSVNPWIAIETLVTREKPGGSAESFGKAEAISLAEALDLFTVNASRQEAMASRVGRIAPGMLADVIVVDRNPFDVPIRQVHAIKVKKTFIGGEQVFDAAGTAPSATAGVAAGDAGPRDPGAEPPDPSRDRWLMMVTTQNTDPTQASAFNDWYDNIDIPDVLRVPGYERARRAMELRSPEFSNAAAPGAARPGDPPKYVALYDIHSPAIDKTIIDMLMASWGMEKLHRSTPLLKVTERVYFRQAGPARVAQTHPSSNGKTYLFTVRFDCCQDSDKARQFDRWYSETYAAALLSAPGFMRVTRYELYRVLMDEPVKIPAVMSVAEIDAESVDRAIEQVREAQARVSGASRDTDYLPDANRELFLQIKDVLRP
jgi:predicted amidohydrolase YtcJ